MNNIKEQISAIRKTIRNEYDKIQQLQSICDHTGVLFKYSADTGNWYKADDKYWIEWRCPICDKRWDTDQDRDSIKLTQTLKGLEVREWGLV